MGITAGSREVPGRNACDRRHAYCIIIMMIIIITTTTIIITSYHHHQGIYIPETNHISRVYSVAAVMYLQFVLHVM